MKDKKTTVVDRRVPSPKITASSTKQEMLEAYQELLREVQERRDNVLSPEAKMEEKATREAVAVADSLSMEGIVQAISQLRFETGKYLNELGDRLQQEVRRYKDVQKAVEIRDKEIEEIYEIKRSAASLAALIEAQQRERQEFESEMAHEKEEREREIQQMREAWEKEKEDHEREIKERDGLEMKKREREREEYLYAFQREQQLAKDQLQDEKGHLEKEIRARKEQVERELLEREKAIAEREQELTELRKKANNFPNELQTAVSKAIKEATDRLQLESKNREELLKKEFEGERNVFTTRIASLEKTLKEQEEQIKRLSLQFEKAYNQVQEIAVKSIEGSSNYKAFTSLQQLVTEQARKNMQEGRPSTHH